MSENNIDEKCFMCSRNQHETKSACNITPVCVALSLGLRCYKAPVVPCLSAEAYGTHWKHLCRAATQLSDRTSDTIVPDYTRDLCRS